MAWVAAEGVVAKETQMDRGLQEYYNRILFFKRFCYDLPRSRKLIVNITKIAKGTVLEVGCGKGHTAIALANKKISFTAIDIDKNVLKIARHNLKALGLLKYVKLMRMNAEKLRFRDRAFTNVISVNFIHHAKNPKKCIKEMIRVVAGKKIIIADFNKTGEKVMDNIHRAEGRKHEKTKISMIKVKRILEKSCFKVKKYRDKCHMIYVAWKGQ